MRLNTFTDYSLRVLLYLAHRPKGQATIAEIARAYDISEHHLVKVVHFLGREGYLENRRGRGGGLGLARAPADIRVGELMRLAEGGDRPAECFDPAENRCVIAGACKLQRALGEALDAFYGALDSYTLADLAMRPKTVKALIRWA